MRFLLVVAALLSIRVASASDATSTPITGSDEARVATGNRIKERHEDETYRSITKRMQGEAKRKPEAEEKIRLTERTRTPEK